MRKYQEVKNLMNWATAKEMRAEMRGKFVKAVDEREEGALEGGPLIDEPEEAVT